MKPGTENTRADRTSEKKEFRGALDPTKRVRAPAPPAKGINSGIGKKRRRPPDPGHKIDYNRSRKDPAERRETTGAFAGTPAFDSCPETDSRFYDVIRLFSGWVWEADARLVCTYCTEKVFQTMGYSAGEMIGTSLFDILDPGEMDRFTMLTEKMAEDHEPLVDMECWCVTREGKRVCLLTSTMPVLDGKGTLAGFRGISRDITDRRKAQESLMMNEQRLKVALRVARIGIWEVDLETFSSKWDDTVYHIFGYRPGSIAPDMNRFLASLHPDDVKKEYRQFNAALKSDVSEYEREYRIVRPDGEVRWIQGYVAIIRNAMGTAVKVIGADCDITQRKLGETTLREDVNRFEVIFENAPDAIFWIDVSTGTIISCNITAESLLGMPRANIIGLHMSMIHPPARNYAYENLYSELSTRGVIEIEGEVKTATEEMLPVHIKGSCTNIAGLSIGQVIIRDIAERKWAEERLEFLNEQLECIVENIGDGITMSDRDGFFLIYNPRMEELTGYTWHEANTLVNFLEVISADRSEYERAIAGIEETVRTGDIHLAEFSVMRKDGTRRVLSVVTNCIRLREHEWLLSAYHDITERKWMEQALRDSELRLKVATDAGALGLWEWAVEENMFIVNERWYEITGMDPSNRGAEQDWMFANMHPDDIGDFKHKGKELVRSLTENNTSEYRVRHPRKGWRWIYLAAQVIEKNRDGSPRRIAGFFQDITDRKRVEEDLKRYREDLEDLIRERTKELLNLNDHLRAEIADRERAEDEIVRLNRHMINILEDERQRLAKDLHDSVGQTILAAKLNLSGSLNGMWVDTNRFNVGMEYIDRASQELREVYSNLYPSLLGDLGLEAAIRWHARNQLEMNGIHVDLEIHGVIDVPHDTAVNLYRITQEIFSNILRHAGASSVRVNLSAVDGNIELAVEDNGVGFSQAERRKSGTGYGLINIRQRVMNMMGNVSIDSLIDGGTKILLTVPGGIYHEKDDDFSGG